MSHMNLFRGYYMNNNDELFNQIVMLLRGIDKKYYSYILKLLNTITKED